MRSAAAQPEKKDAPKKEEEAVEKIEVETEPEVDFEIEDEVQVEEPVVAKTEPKSRTEPPKKEEDDRAALLKRIEESQRAEQLAKQRAAEYERKIAEQQSATAKVEQERDRLRLDSESNQLDAINAAMAAAKAESDAAELALEQAIQDANPKGQAEAHRRLAKAEGNLARLQDGKDELEYRLSLLQAERRKEPEPKIEKKPEKEERPDVIEAMPIPDRAKEWLREHREFAEDQRKNAKLQVAHWDALDEGHKEFSTPYFAAVERLLGLGPKEEPQIEVEENNEEIEPVRKPAPKPQQRSAIVSAPVSREGSTTVSSTPSRSQVKLTKEEAEFAEQIGMTHAEFAKQKLKLQEMKRKGEIQ